jgi:hypothetical protein
MFVNARSLLDDLQRIATRIPFTGEILAAARLRKARRAPPKDVKDLEIYESILAFARLNQSLDVAFIFQLFLLIKLFFLKEKFGYFP